MADTRTKYTLRRYFYKILPSAPPTPLPAALPLSDLDRKDGFIHLSTAAQVPTTASLFFAAHTTLALLKVDTRATLQQGGVYSWAQDQPECPHLSAPRGAEWLHLGSENVRDWREVRRAEGQSWEDALEPLRDEGWLADSDSDQ